ncbi:MAG: hypothetical protein H7Y09_08250 [Chitinophagaceae bacterium]|nr:hypothetical protein [Anaerolineae bacterium]
MLKTSQIALFIGLGIAFWLTGLLFIRVVGPVIFTPDNPLIIVLYLASFPMLFAAIAIASAISRLPMKDMLEPMVIMTFSAIFIDGAVIALLPEAYGDDLTQVMRAAAWLLWGGAAGLLCAWLLSLRGNSA